MHFAKVADKLASLCLSETKKFQLLWVDEDHSDEKHLSLQIADSLLPDLLLELSNLKGFLPLKLPSVSMLTFKISYISVFFNDYNLNLIYKIRKK